MTWKKSNTYHKTKVTPKDADKMSAKTGEIKRKLDDLTASAAKAFDTRRRFWFYTVLQGALAVYIEWKAEGNSKKNAKIAAALFGVKRAIGDHPFRTIIKILTPDGVDTRRWVNGLRFAYQQGIAPKDLVGFLNANGGIAGCARKFRTKA
jgi:hypothetical protein